MGNGGGRQITVVVDDWYETANGQCRVGSAHHVPDRGMAA